MNWKIDEEDLLFREVSTLPGHTDSSQVDYPLNLGRWWL